MTIFERARKLNLPLGEYIIVGGVMEAHGLRPANDIDVVAKPGLFQELIKAGWPICDCDKCQQNPNRQVLKGDEVDVYSDYSAGESYRPDTDWLISQAEMIEGFPFLPMPELLNWKKAASRKKDLPDIEIITEYLKSNG